MTTINTIDDLLRLLDENEQLRDAVRYRILTEDLVKLPQEFREFRRVRGRGSTVVRQRWMV